MDYNEYRNIFDLKIQSLYTHLNSDSNKFNKSKNARPLKFYMMETVDNTAPKPEINAYALYRDREDAIFMTTELYRLIYNIFDRCVEDIGRVSWMAYLASLLCIFHEFGHLYLGHSQICNGNRLAIFHNPSTGLSYLDHQSLEMDADSFASSRITEEIASVLISGLHKSIHDYKDETLFYRDSIKAIDGFFYLLRYMEGKQQRNNPDYSKRTHPPSMARCVFSRDALIYLLQKVFSISYPFDRLNTLLEDDKLFSDIWGIEPFFEDYKMLLDDSIIGYQKLLRVHWSQHIRQRLWGLNRVPFTIYPT